MDSSERAAQDEQCPPITDDVERAGDRVGHELDTLGELRIETKLVAVCNQLGGPLETRSLVTQRGEQVVKGFDEAVDTLVFEELGDLFDVDSELG